MAKKSVSLIRSLRDRRGLSQKDLAGLSQLVERTVRSAEQDPSSVSMGTMRSILGAVSEVAPFTALEAAAIAEALAWSTEAVWQVDAEAGVRRGAQSNAGNGRDKLDRALELLDDDADPLGEVVDTVYQLCVAHAKRKQRSLLAEPNLPKIIQQLTGRVMIELHRDYIPKKDEDQIIYTARLPSSIDLGGQEVMTEYYNESGRPMAPVPELPKRSRATRVTRVIIPPTLREDGSEEQRFEYFTEEGVRLIPAPPEPPNADPLEGDRQA